MDFYRRMEVVCGRIPYGNVVSYGQIALLCGKPKNARQVGYALSHRCLESEVPAWRIVNGRGFLSGAASFDYPDMQKLLLRGEGVEVSAELYVDLEKYGWKHTLADVLELRELFEKQGI